MLVIRASKSGRWETVLLVALLFVLIENDQLLIPNPLMPPPVMLRLLCLATLHHSGDDGAK
jgi:hypothetical protein